MSFWKKIGVLFGAITTSLPLWPYIKRLLEWGEHGEFILHRIYDLRVVGPMLEAVLTPALWQPLTLTPAGLFVLWLALRKGNSKPKIAADAVPDIDARAAFFEILDNSVWSKHQLETTTDIRHLVSNWLAVKLDTEIHKALRNSRLKAWGEQNLPGFATTPEKPIPDDAWDNIEIDFDRSTLPRTLARFKGRTRHEPGPMAWVGVKFSSAQIFQLFPIGPAAKPQAAQSIDAPSKTLTTRVAFSETQRIKMLPPSLGGNMTLRLDNVATLRLGGVSRNSITLILDVVPVDLAVTHSPGVSVEGAQIFYHTGATQYVFDTHQNQRKEIMVVGRTFIVTLLQISKLAVAEVANPVEYVFGISEK
jgi:hypothetical protein